MSFWTFFYVSANFLFSFSGRDFFIRQKLLCSFAPSHHLKSQKNGSPLHHSPSLLNIMLALYFKTEEVFIYWFNCVVLFMIVKIIVDFYLQTELQLSTFYRNRDWKRTGDWDPVSYRLVLKKAVFEYIIFFETNLRYKF